MSNIASRFRPFLRSLHTSMPFPAIARWMLRSVGFKFPLHLLVLLFGERDIALSVSPAVSPAIPGGKCGMSSRANAVEHQVRKGLTAGALEYAVPKLFIGLLAVLLGASAPIGNIVRQAAIAPERPVFEVAVREQAAPVAREVMEVGSRGGSDDEQGSGDDQQYRSGNGWFHFFIPLNKKTGA